MKKKILIGSIIVVMMLVALTFPTALCDSDEIVDKKNKVYKLARIRTTQETGGHVICIPGVIRSFGMYTGYMLLSFVMYNWDICEGWYLTINGEEVGRGRGFIFGFTGNAQNHIYLPGEPDYSAFDLVGFGLMVIHIPD